MPATAIQEQHIILSGQICEQDSIAPELQGSDIRVTIIAGGQSINGFSYDAQALQEIARLVEGARAYADHGRTPEDLATRSVRDMVGFYQNAQYIAPHLPDNPQGRVDATLHILEAAQWLRSMVKEAISLGKPDLVGLSIDIFGDWQQESASSPKRVTNVRSLNSCDIVTRPSAGGSLQRILHSDDKTGGNHPMPELITTQDPPTPTPAPQPAPAPDASRITEEMRLLEAQRILMAQAMEEIKREKCAMLLERRLMESGFPQPVITQIREQYKGRVFEDAQFEATMSSYQTMLAELTAANLIRGQGYEKPGTVSGMITEAEKVQFAIEEMFSDLVPNPTTGKIIKMHSDEEYARFAGVKAFDSIREAYARVTGDASVAGFNDRSQLGSIRIGEGALGGVGRISEADTTTASFSFLLGTSMNKRLLKDYQAWPAEWQKFCTIAPIKDFKQQTRVRLGAFGSLSTVAEDTAYTTISLTDTAATYVPTKRGNLVTVSRETIVNDDLFAIKQIPTKLAVAAAYTLAEFVYSFLSSNPAIYDGNALFTSGTPHSNLGSAALSTASMQSGVTAMREQTNFASKRLGLRPSFLIVPPELEFVAMVVTKSAGVPGSVNNDINPMLGYVTPIVSPQLTNTSQWFFAADPKVIDTIEIGFVGGQVNPALMVQDQPLWGLNFTQDVVSFKCRHEYGGGILDYRGLYRGI